MRAASGSTLPSALPAGAGIGLRAAHWDAALAARPPVAFLEVHSENYFGEGGRPHAVLHALRGQYPLSLHGVGLSLGGTDPLDRRHLGGLASLARRYEPAAISDHLCWVGVAGRWFNELLPLPYTEESLYHVAARVDEVQAILGRRVLVENVSSYAAWPHSTIPEWEFLAALAQCTGCGLLLDVNNVHVSATNLGFDARAFLDGLPASAVAEFHLAGHTARRTPAGALLLDTHDRPVAEPVWALYAHALRRFGPRPTLIEWDADLPALDVLVGEALHARALMEDDHAIAA